MEQDTFYILSIANLHEHIDAKLLLNSSSYVNNGVNFWREVDVLLIYCLYIAYQLDFETFDFDPVEYLETKNLPEKAQKLKKLLITKDSEIENLFKNSL